MFRLIEGQKLVVARSESHGETAVRAGCGRVNEVARRRVRFDGKRRQRRPRPTVQGAARDLGRERQGEVYAGDGRGDGDWRRGLEARLSPVERSRVIEALVIRGESVRSGGKHEAIDAAPVRFREPAPA